MASPEVRISSLDSPDLHGFPSLSASGSRIFSSWMGDGGAPRVGVGYSYSMNAGGDWIQEVGLAAGPPLDGVFTPSFSCQPSPLTTYLLTNEVCLQTFRGIGSQPISWGPATVALCDPLYPGDSHGADIAGLACDTASGHVYLTCTEGTETTYISWIRFARSVDGGDSWQPPLQLGGPNAMGSSLAVGPDGTLYLSWVDYALGQVLLSRSTDGGTSFQPAVPVANIRDNLTARPIGWFRSQASPRSYPYYRFTSGQFAANFPALAVDRSSGPTRGNLYLTWAEPAEGTVPAQLTTVGSTEVNDTFAQAQPIPLDCVVFGALDDVHSGTNFVDTYVCDGLAGETLELGGTASPWVVVDGYMERADGSLVRAIPDVVLCDPALGVVKPAIFTLPRTGRYFLVVQGFVLGASYQFTLRHYTPTAGSVARDMRDIVLVGSTDGGATWSPKLRVNHDAAGADQSQPNVAVDERGRLYVAWYDRRDGVDGLEVNAYAARSDDGGRTFSRDLRLSSRGSRWDGVEHPDVPLRPGELVGDRIALAAGDDFAVVAWADFRDWPQGSQVFAARIVDVPTAVAAVSDLAATPEPDGVRLSWLVNDARAVAGLRPYRAHADEPEAPLGEADLVPSAAGRLDYLDATARPGERYTYRLRVSTAERTDWLGPVDATLPAAIPALAWRAAWPNPFARRTQLRLAVPRAAAGSVRVYDLQGKPVRTLAEGAFAPGERTLQWDGRDAAGAPAAPGIYFLSASVGGNTARLRLALVP